MLMVSKKEIYKLQANICQVLGNEKRIEIIELLKSNELSAGELREKMGIPKANLSQHLTIMKQRGILIDRREGVNIYYKIANLKVVTACQIMKEVLLEDFKRVKEIVS